MKRTRRSPLTAFTLAALLTTAAWGAMSSNLESSASYQRSEEVGRQASRSIRRAGQQHAHDDAGEGHGKADEQATDEPSGEKSVMVQGSRIDEHDHAYGQEKRHEPGHEARRSDALDHDIGEQHHDQHAEEHGRVDYPG